MKNAWYLVLTALILLAVVLPVQSQPVLRDGWPHDYSSPGGMAPFVEPNPLAVATGSDGTRYIATADIYTIRLFDIDGTLLQDWATTGLVPNSFSANYLAGGPNLGDVDGDGSLEVVAVLRKNTGRSRALAVLELNGDLNGDLSRAWDMGTDLDIGSVVCANVDGDEYPEIVLTVHDEIHAIDQDGSDVEGFPWTLDEAAHVGSTVIVIPPEMNDGTAALVWMSSTAQLHVREVDATSDLPGWPVDVNTQTNNVINPPAVVYHDGGWLVTYVFGTDAYVINPDGTNVAGFPYDPGLGTANSFTGSSVADVNGDGTPDLVFRTWNDDQVYALGIDGVEVDGWPYDMGTDAGRSEIVSSFKPFADEAPYLFSGSLGPGANDQRLVGLQNTTALDGFPVQFTTNENVPVAYTAVFPPDDSGTISIVLSTANGYTTVYDLTIDGTLDWVMEWGNPFGTAGGNRLYAPATGIEPPAFVFTPTEVEFDDTVQGELAEATISMSCNADGSIDDAAFVVNDPEGDLELDADFPSTYTSGDSETWTLSWTPSTGEALTDTLRFTYTVGGEETIVDIPLSGTVIVPPELIIPGLVDFGTITDEDPTVTMDLEIENTGDGEGVITEIVVDAGIEDVITVDADLPITIAPGAMVAIPITWTPEEFGDLDGDITLSHNDPALGGQSVVQLIGTFTNSVGEGSLPNEYALEQNYPNPFNPETTIQFSLREAGDVRLTVYNVHGQVVETIADGTFNAGRHEIAFNASHLAGGIYFYRLDVNGFHAVKKMMLVR
ncbi:T9SS type A sorting domain-containing protein [bacterium]|nr:T9SS type A sorting domain-containing protein [bacterium]